MRQRWPLSEKSRKAEPPPVAGNMTGRSRLWVRAVRVATLPYRDARHGVRPGGVAMSRSLLGHCRKEGVSACSSGYLGMPAPRARSRSSQRCSRRTDDSHPKKLTCMAKTSQGDAGSAQPTTEGSGGSETQESLRVSEISCLTPPLLAYPADTLRVWISRPPRTTRSSSSCSIVSL